MKSYWSAWLPFFSLNRRLKINFQKLKTALTLAGSLFLTTGLHAHVSAERGLGLNPHTQEHIQHLEDNWDSIVQVKPNKVGSERLKHTLGKNKVEELDHEAAEFIVVKVQENAPLLASNPSTAALPSSVDNSQLPSFPPIGDQKALGSCVAWGTTYYQATHEYGLLHGINNKTSVNHIFSPKWTYNNLNGGEDGGLYIYETYQLFSQNGLVSIDRLPYDTDYRSWDLNPQDWVSAIYYRTTPGQLISGIGGATQNLQVIKQLLNNGHVLTFGTFINSWKMTTVKRDPSAASNPHAGELAASWMSGTNGGHCMTIVGYDDNIWIDVNNNGKVDPGEKGAFLVANSWGEGWGNKGFIWVAYDAFLSKSAVVNGPTYNRVALADAMGSYVVSAVPIAKNYSPKIIAQFALTQTIREQINVSVGVSDANSTKPSKIFKSYAVYNQGGSYEFDGDVPKNPETATFALDLSDLLTEMPDSQKRFYLLIGDNARGNPTTIQSFSITDLVNNRTIKSAQVPMTVDNANGLVYLDYDSEAPDVPDLPVPPQEPPALKITSPLNNQTVSSSVWLAASAKDKIGIDRVEFYVDSVLVATDKTDPYYVLYKTQKLKRGKHKLTVIAYNKRGDSSTETVSFNVGR